MKPVIILLKLYFPLFIFFFFIFVVILTKKIDDTKIKFPIISKFITAEFLVKNLLLNKVLFFAFLCIGLVSYYVTLDYTKFFPTNLQLTVHLDDSYGTQELYKQIGIKEFEGFKIEFDSTILRNHIHYGDSTIFKKFGIESFYSDPLLNGIGKLDVKGESNIIGVKERGIQNYYFTESNGWLTWSKIVPGKKTQMFQSKFNKISSKYDKFHCNLIHSIFNNKIILPITFSESLSNGINDESVDHFLHTLTIIKPLPYPNYGNTLYLLKKDDKMVPIGYGVYFSKD